jgi:CRISPR-associated endonuclease/helicase Cas3
MNHPTNQHDGVLLSGLDGSNPLAFLAAMGTFRTIARAWLDQPVAMSWAVQRGMWSPSIHMRKPMTETFVIDTLVQSLRTDAAKHPIAFMTKGGRGGDKEGTKKAKKGKQLPARSAGGDAASTEQATICPDIAKFFSERAGQSTPADREALDWLSAMTSDLAPDTTSQLQTARRDYFWGNLESVMKLCEPKHLCRTLFQPWDYADPLDNQSLHIEPSEDRRHAHQWSQPSGDPDRQRRGGMLGANRLAIEAFPFFQSVAQGNKLATRGFFGRRTDDTRWTWPLWDCPIGADVVASLLALADLQPDSPRHRSLAARGIKAVFRCRRILVGKTPNFTPAMAV